MSENIIDTNQYWNSVQCKTGCANCCPKDCRHLTKENLCRVHPMVLGITDVEAERRHDRGMGCHSSPITIFTYGVYCPPVAEKLQELLRKEIEGYTIHHHTGDCGVEMIDDAKKVYDDTRKFRGF